MPKHEGVYAGPKGGWYYKVFVERDPLTGKSVSITRRGFATAAAASKARREYLESMPSRTVAPSGLTVNELLDMFFEDAAARGKLAAKTGPIGFFVGGRDFG